MFTVGAGDLSAYATNPNIGGVPKLNLGTPPDGDGFAGTENPYGACISAPYGLAMDMTVTLSAPMRAPGD